VGTTLPRACIASALLLAALAGANAGAQPAMPTGEVARPLPVVTASPLPLQEGAAPPMAVVRLPKGHILGVAAATAFVQTTDGRLHAVDLIRGHDRWTKPPHTGGWQPPAASETRVFFPADPMSDDPALTIDDLRTGHLIGRWPGVLWGHVLGPILYAKTTRGYAAYVVATGEKRWETLGGGWRLGETPTQHGSVLLQDFTDSGALTLNVVYAFDVRTGHARYIAGYGLLHATNDVGYADATWFPRQADFYSPLTIVTFRLTDGATLQESNYAPDPARRTAPSGYALGAREVHVGGGYVYFTVEADHYRYVADRPPAQADPARFHGVQVADAFDSDAVLVTTSHSAGIARSLPDRLEVHPLASGPLRSPIAQRADGMRLAVVGTRLLAISPRGDNARPLGRVACSDPAEIFTWLRHVAVPCGAADSTGPQQLLVFADDVAVATPQPLPTPALAPSPRFTARLTGYPPRRTDVPDQWELYPLALEPDGSAVVTLVEGNIQAPTTLRRITRDGAATDVALPPGAAPVLPTAVIADGTGRLWYTDTAHPGLVRSYDVGTGVRTYAIVAGDDPVTPPASTAPAHVCCNLGWPTPVRIALGPDGAIWFARNHPRPEIGRVVDGSGFAIPATAGPALQLLGGDNGALWFLSHTVVGRMTTDGHFSQVALPAAFTTLRDRPQLTLVAGPGGTAWVFSDTTLVQFDATHILRTLTLPNATLKITTAATGCDGALYVGESAAQMARIDADHFDEFPLNDIDGVEHLMRAPNCQLWYTARDATPSLHVGTLTITRR